MSQPTYKWVLHGGYAGDLGHINARMVVDLPYVPQPHMKLMIKGKAWPILADHRSQETWPTWYLDMEAWHVFVGILSDKDLEEAGCLALGDVALYLQRLGWEIFEGDVL